MQGLWLFFTQNTLILLLVQVRNDLGGGWQIVSISLKHGLPPLGLLGPVGFAVAGSLLPGSG
jgi:hypothetical protein